MAVFYLPVGQDPDETTTFTLDSIRYDFRVRYNQRLGNESLKPINNEIQEATKYDGWKLYISLAGQDPFIETPLKTSRDLLGQHRYKPFCPTGTLVLADITAVNAQDNPQYYYSPERVNFDELGTRFRLTYIDNT
jgi:hypothetical protein